jgi:hypothetical protein
MESACSLDAERGFIRFAKGGPGGKGDPAGGGRGEGIQSLLPLQHILVFTAIPKWDPHFADGTHSTSNGTLIYQRDPYFPDGTLFGSAGPIFTGGGVRHRSRAI